MNIDLQGTGRVRQTGCPLFCPGCHDRDIGPADRLAEKERFIRNVLFVWQDRMWPVQQASPENRRGYREKVCLAAGWREDGWRFGFHHRQTLIPVHSCPIHSSRINSTIDLLTGVMPPFEKFPLAYFLQTGGQVTLVVKSRDLPDIAWLTKAVTEVMHRIGNQGVWIHLHPAAGRRVTAKNTWRLVWGEPRSTDRAGLMHGPTAFQQLIPELSEAALDRAEAFLAPGTDDFVLDLYCGIGSSLRRWTRHARQVVGVEINGESVDCAGINAPEATILRGTGRHRLPQLTAMLPPDGSSRLLYANPPRMGIEPEVTDWIGDVFKPSKFACLSCNAVSLKKDLMRLTKAGYRVERIIPFDFFPGTRYLEIMVLLMREESNNL